MKIRTRPCTGDIINDTAAPYLPLTKRVLAGRGIDSPNTLQYSLTQLHPVNLLGNVQAAAELLAEAVAGEHSILIVGDYDADGATATAVSMRALNMMGHQQVDYLVPDRFKYGYGLTEDIVGLAHEHKPWLLMTVDNGVSSIEGVEAAKKAGYRTLITDHHLPGEQLPDADVMVNPNLHEDTFPSGALAGVGVVFYVMLALKKLLSEQGYFTEKGLKEPNLTSLLDLVALGTVADVVPLDENNRILVEQGLRRIRAGYGQPGVTALLEQGGRNALRVVSSDFGFVCGPRLNAAGRLSDMSLGIRCLLTDDHLEARRLAYELDELNNERKRIEADMKEEAQAIIQSVVFDQDAEIPSIMCLHQDDWHEGVIGILASRIKDKYYRPVIVFASAENGWVKGSARSIEGLHIRDLIDEVAARNPGLIPRFGGHAMAAGLTLPEAQLDHFVAEITDAVLRQAKADTFREVVFTDGALQAEDFTLECAGQLRDVAPWGQHFPEPQFEGSFEIVQSKVLKDLHLKLELRPVAEDGSLMPMVIPAINFFADLEQWPEAGERVYLVYKLSVNEFRGNRTLQLMVDLLTL
uniref:Single-stranded-DNA-specific exonuclease RecJ n=1 Tax=uncultured Thiotrichaceae bacterium TaxID=298394 RepID=A0A6S6SRF8_9GAMM|nr:MAG: Single-stranded-DNA-specific exonuclease RecJ (EC [uncultured Thiotrichaceae bacterium]